MGQHFNGNIFRSVNKEGMCVAREVEGENVGLKGEVVGVLVINHKKSQLGHSYLS